MSERSLQMIKKYVDKKSLIFESRNEAFALMAFGAGFMWAFTCLLGLNPDFPMENETDLRHLMIPFWIVLTIWLIDVLNYRMTIGRLENYYKRMEEFNNILKSYNELIASAEKLREILNNNLIHSEKLLKEMDSTGYKRKSQTEYRQRILRQMHSFKNALQSIKIQIQIHKLALFKHRNNKKPSTPNLYWKLYRQGVLR